MRNPKNPVGDAVRARRAELGINQNALAVKAEVSHTTVLNLEKGIVNQRAAVTRRIEEALGWPRGAIARVAAGEPVDTAGGVDAPANVGKRLDALEATMRELLDAVSHLTTPAPKRGRGLRR